MAKTLNPGSFRHNITFMEQTDERGESGHPLDDWTPFKAVRAAMEPLIGKELFAALTEDTRIDVKFKMRWFSGVKNTMRIRHAGEVYEIISAVDYNASHKELVCYCRLVT